MLIYTESDLKSLLDQSAALHSHLCPRQVLGVRMGMYAAQLFDLPLPQTDKRLFTFVETDGCFVDGLSVATGCTLGHRTLHLMDFGKIAATIVDTQTRCAVRIWPTDLSRQRAVELMPDAESRWHAQLEGYQIMPFPDLFNVQDVCVTLSLAELISRPSARAVCARCGEEISNEREVVINGETLCRPCAEGAYYQVMTPISLVPGLVALP